MIKEQQHQQMIDYFKANFLLELNDSDIEDIFSVVDSYRMPELSGIPVLDILYHVSQYTQVSVWNMKGKTRLRNYVFARQLFFFLCKRHTSTTLKDMGIVLNNDHTTVIHGVNYIKNMLSINDGDTVAAISSIEARLYLLIKERRNRFKFTEIDFVKDKLREHAY